MAESKGVGAGVVSLVRDSDGTAQSNGHLEPVLTRLTLIHREWPDGSRENVEIPELGDVPIGRALKILELARLTVLVNVLKPGKIVST